MGACTSSGAALSPMSPRRQFSPIFRLPLTPKYPTTLQALHSESPQSNIYCANWPDRVKIRISLESVDILTHWTEEPIIYIPYHELPGWKGSSSGITLKVKKCVFDRVSSPSGVVRLGFHSSEGKTIQKCMIGGVENLQKALMDCVIDEKDFNVILTVIFNESKCLQKNWTNDCDFELGGKRISAQQAMTVFATARQDNFDDLLTLSCYLYYRVMCRDSFGLILSSVENPSFRKNIAEKLGAKNARSNSQCSRSSSEASIAIDDGDEISYSQVRASLSDVYVDKTEGF